MRKLLSAAVLLAAGAPPAWAQQAITAPGGFVPRQAVSFAGGDGKAVTASAATPLPITDLPFSGVVAMTVGSPVAAQRSIGANCSAGGSATIVMADGSSVTVPLSAGWQTFPFAATQVAATTATCTFYQLI